MPDDIIDINELVKKLEENGYIDCGEFTDYNDDNEYKSIVWYLKQIQTIINDIRNTDIEIPINEKKFNKLKNKFRKKRDK